jgi:hypothetical protein
MNDPSWMQITEFADISASSEAAQHPVASAFVAGTESEWKASEPGPQVLAVRFRAPRTISRIKLVIIDADYARTQELSITWSSDRGERHGVAVRQQFNFSPRGATRQVEDYTVDLRDVASLELRIVPDVSGGPGVARVAQFSVA